MKFEEDYVMRMIKDMVKALACVVFGKRFTEYEVEEEKADDTVFIYRDIIEMADRGKINEAENILLTDMDRTDKRYMEMAMSFYLHINKYTDEFLSANGYSQARKSWTGWRHWLRQTASKDWTDCLTDYKSDRPFFLCIYPLTHYTM